LTPTISARIAASGGASVAGTLVLLRGLGSYQAGRVYTVVSAPGGISGNFRTLTNTRPELNFIVTETATTIDVESLTNFISGSANLGLNATNQRAVAGVLDTLSGVIPGDIGQLVNAAQNLPAAQRGQALDQLSGQSYADFLTAGRDSFRAFLGGVREQFDGAGQADGGAGAGTDRVVLRAARWGNGFGKFTSVRGNGNGAGVNATTSGGTVGILGMAAQAGAALGYSHADFSVDGLGQSGGLDMAALGAYGEQRWGGVFLDGIAGAAYEHGDGDRRIAFGGVERRASGSFDGFSAGGLALLGWRWQAEPALLIEPSASLAYVHIGQGSVAETGGNCANLLIARKGQNTLQSVTGARIVQRIDTSSGPVRPELRVAWT
jgi:outer membrane autotransporter protein